jgi:hypothetical protein
MGLTNDMKLSQHVHLNNPNCEKVWIIIVCVYVIFNGFQVIQKIKKLMKKLVTMF